MSIFGKDKDLELLLQPYREQIESLKAEVSELKAEKDKLLDALLSVKTPEAYKEMRSDIRETKNTPEIDPTDIERLKIHEETTKKWFEGLEAPVFRGPDEMVGMLDKWLTKEPAPLTPAPVIDSEGYQDA